MKKLLLPLIVLLALPTAYAETCEERLHICARHKAHQITYQKTAELLGIKEIKIAKEDRYNGNGMPRNLKQAVTYYCNNY